MHCATDRERIGHDKFYGVVVVALIVSVDIAVPIERVWAEAADLASHSEWMADTESIEILTGPKLGIGTQMIAATKVGPFRTNDTMEVVAWEEGKSIGVRHTGLITGEGRFILDETPQGTRFTWTEILSFPWYLGGPVTALVAKLVLQRIWLRNLERFRNRLDSSTSPN